MFDYTFGMSLAEIPNEHLEAAIAEGAANLAAAECRWLELVAEFDRRELAGSWGARSTAHVLNFMCGISLRTAYEQVRVARRLEELPLAREGFASGQLSYSKVRAISRIATPETEQTLVDTARTATASQMERLARSREFVSRRYD
jgi:hypothetical protein